MYINNISSVMKKDNFDIVAYRQLLISNPPWGRYLAKDWDPITQKLYEASRNGRDAITTNVQSKVCIGNGIVAPNLVCLYGSITSTIIWPLGSLPPQFTICTLARYTATGAKRRIFQGKTVNWLHGFYNAGNRRSNFYNNMFTFDEASYSISDWCIDCATNNIGTPNYTILNNVRKPTFPIPTRPYFAPDAIAINSSSSNNEFSDFEFGQLIIWDRQLTLPELEIISNGIQHYMVIGNL